MISSDEPDVLELYAKWEKIEEVGDSNEDNILLIQRLIQHHIY